MIAGVRAQPGDMRRDGRGERVQWQAGKAGQARAASVVCAVRNALRFRWGRQRHGARDLAAWARARGRALREHTPCAVFDVIKGGRVTKTARAAVVPSADTRQPRRTPAHAAPPGPRARPRATRARDPAERARPARPFNDVCGLWSILELDESPSTPHRQRPAARCGTWRLPAVPTTTRLAPPLSVRRQRVPLASLPSPWSGLAVSK